MTIHLPKIPEFKKEDIGQYRIALLLFILLLIPNLYTLFYSTDLKGNLKISCAYIVLCISIWAVVAAVAGLKNMFRIGLLFLLFAPVEIGFVKSVGMPINTGLMEALLHTDFNEAKEQISSHIGLLIIWAVVISSYLFLLFRLQTIRFPLKVRFCIPVVFVFLNLILYWQMYRTLIGYDVMDRPEAALKITVKKYQKIYPVNILINGYSAYTQEQENTQMMKKLATFRFGATQVHQNHSPEIFVLVIGETARYAAFHINGYPRETSPNLEKTTNLIRFTNMYTAANLTSISVPQIITRAQPTDFNLQFKEKTLVDAFQEAGFYTAWISNQSSESPVINRLKSLTDYSYFSPKDHDSDTNYDGFLLKNLDAVLQNPAPKKLIVIHTLGSHFRYVNRYPVSFEKFRPTSEKSGYDHLTADNREKLLNSYDNSILYTDWFLSQVISKIRKTDSSSAMLYLSDHGENIFDDERKLFSHGTGHPSRYEYHIPYFVWLSPAYINSHPEQARALEANRNQKASSTATFYTLLDMANIRYRNSVQERYKSLANPKYKAPEQRKMLNSEKKIIRLPD